ncbi:MAG: amidohydrolase family protein [Ilumatobacteraceae bacterium]|nr:amidohydrolase family protein [Ilumatobacteraceae bacterium]MBU6240900.1 amidohydrolase family protein [Acidobacteriota bacterium]
MLDVLIRGGEVVDGTGAPRRRADVGIADGKVVAVGKVDGDARKVIDATGKLVTPGFIDLHTHYDAQAFWDTSLSPSPLHGVTTVMAGNCGFTIAPLTPQDGDYLMRMLARVEGMPLESLQEGVPWNWTTTGEFLDSIDGKLMPNAGFLVGHSALRRVVMHDDATRREATPEEIEAMKELLRAGLRAGGMGFSSTWSTSHNDHTGVPVPSRHGSREELIALCSVVSEFPGTTLEFIPAVGRFERETFELMADMSAAANRPLNWNLLQVYAQNWDLVQHQLEGYDVAKERGGKVLALTLPDTFRTRLNLRSGFILDILNGWDELMALPPEEKLAMLRDPKGRQEMNDKAQATVGPTRSIGNWAAYMLLETFTDKWKPYQGRLIGDIAKELGKEPWDALADIVVDDNLNTVITVPDKGQGDDTWAKRVEVWRDDRAIVGASDAGAHLDMIDSFSFSTTMLARAVRERNLMSFEEAITHLTDKPARLYGLRDRGRLQEGYFADVVVLDPDTVGPGEVYMKFDLPGGAGRVYGEAIGIEHVIVNGVPAVEHGEILDARPGALIRSGRDTDTVTAR